MNTKKEYKISPSVLIMALALLISSCSDNSHSALQVSNQTKTEHTPEDANIEAKKLRYTSPTPEQIEKILRHAAEKKQL